MLTALNLQHPAQRATVRGDFAFPADRRRHQPFRFAPAGGRKLCLAGAPQKSHAGWLERWQIPFRPRRREWIIPVLLFLAAMVFQLREKVAVERSHPWRPELTATALGRTEAALQLPYDPKNFPLTEEDALRDVLVSDGSMAPMLAIGVADTISREARALGYDPFLALAIMHVESGFHPEAMSQRGAEGLMQVMPKTQRWLLQQPSFDNERRVAADPMLATDSMLSRDPLLPADPLLNVRLGMRYFGSLQRSFGRLDLALAAYNCGPGRLLSSLKDSAPLPFETEMYAQKVLHRYKRFRSDYDYIGTHSHGDTSKRAPRGPAHSVTAGLRPVVP